MDMFHNAGVPEHGICQINGICGSEFLKVNLLSNSRYGKGCYYYQIQESGFVSVHLHIELMENRWPIYGS